MIRLRRSEMKANVERHKHEVGWRSKVGKKHIKDYD